jgi:hypothetical protein
VAGRAERRGAKQHAGVAGVHLRTADDIEDPGAGRKRSATGWAELAEIEAYTAANVPPTMSLSTPIEGATSVAPATFALAAQAADTDGPVTKVQFLANGTLLFEDTASPFAFDWTNIAAGAIASTAAAVEAARKSRQVLAFEQAAAFYAEAIRLGSSEPELVYARKMAK